MTERERLMESILSITDEHGFNTDMMPGYLYAKVLYLAESLEPFLTEDELEKIRRYGVRRGVESIAGRPDYRGIPDKCFAVIHGSVAIIQKDVSGYVDLGIELDEPDALEFAASENQKLGVTDAQAKAMMTGLTDGWDLALVCEDGVPARSRIGAPVELDTFGNEQILIGGA